MNKENKKSNILIWNSECFYHVFPLFVFPFYAPSLWTWSKKYSFIIKRWYFWNYFLFKLLCLWEKHFEFWAKKIFFPFCCTSLTRKVWSNVIFLYFLYKCFFYICVLQKSVEGKLKIFFCISLLEQVWLLIEEFAKISKFICSSYKKKKKEIYNKKTINVSAEKKDCVKLIIWMKCNS